MWLWSKGLGRLILPMEIDQATVRHVPDDGTLVVEGLIIAPKVRWDYSLTMTQQDLLDSIRLMTNTRVASYMARETGLGFLRFLLATAFRAGWKYCVAQCGRVTKRNRRTEGSGRDEPEDQPASNSQDEDRDVKDPA